MWSYLGTAFPHNRTGNCVRKKNLQQLNIVSSCDRVLTKRIYFPLCAFIHLLKNNLGNNFFWTHPGLKYMCHCSCPPRVFLPVRMKVNVSISAFSFFPPE